MPDSGYKGFVDVEYEGSELSERDGVIATKKLLEKVFESRHKNMMKQN